MSGIFGILGLNDHERVYLSTLGQDVIFDAANEFLNRHAADLEAMAAIFVDETTENHKERYKLPGGGRLQQMSGQSSTATVKALGQWDVAFPLIDYGASVGMGRIDFAYATAQDLQRHLETITIQNINTVRHEILKALLNNTQRTFADNLWGNLLIESLANGDAVVYPPALGSETEATDDHYLESNYTTANISNTNDPVITVVDELEEHFGAPTGGSNIVCFVPTAVGRKIRGLAEFDPVIDRFIDAGDDTDQPVGLPAAMPGRIMGRHNAGAWIVEWRHMPADYLLAIHQDAPRPLKRRVHPGDTGLPQSLTLVKDSDQYPFQQSHYENHFGFGAGNRLNGVVMEMGTGGTYSIPSGYA